MTEIAVVVTCYNLGRTLDETLASLAVQTRPAAEVVVVDDGSDDLFTRQVIARLERAPPPRTRIIRRAHAGQSAARNHGAGLTLAPYLLFLDADDRLAATYLEQAAGLLDRRPELAFVSCAQRGFGAAEYVWKPATPRLAEAIAFGVPHVSTVLRRGLWDDVGGYDEDVHHAEVRDFWATALGRGYRGEVLDEPLLHYRVRPGSAYRRMIAPAKHRVSNERFYRKHREAVSREMVEVLVAQEAFLLDQRAHQRHLVGREQELEAELDRCNRELAGLRAELLATRGAAIDLGELDRLTPLSDRWGLERGGPLDRHYIEGFLARHRADIRGRVVEVKDPGYSERFGSGQVLGQDVVDVQPGNPSANRIADLTEPDPLPVGRYDCFVMTQTLNIVRDPTAVLAAAASALAAGGVLLLTVSALNRVSYEDGGLDGDYWRFTAAGMRELLARHFPLDAFTVESHGNVLACAAFLYGLSRSEFPEAELDHVDPWYPLVIAARAVKPGTRALPSVRTPARAGGTAVVLAYHRVIADDELAAAGAIRAGDLRRQLEQVAREYEMLPLVDLVAARAAGTLPERAVAVTFDDGTADHLYRAAPLLEELGVPATFFVTGLGLDQPEEPWWAVLDRLFFGGDTLPARLELPGWDGLDGVATATVADRAAAHRQLTEHLYALAADRRGTLLEGLVGWCRHDLPPRPERRFLLADEVRELDRRAGLDVAVHGAKHLPLPGIPLAARCFEIARGRYLLERIVRRDLTLFAYPFGEHSSETVELVRDAGFAAAFTVAEGAVDARADPWLLPRLEVVEPDVDALAARLDRWLSGATRVG